MDSSTIDKFVQLVVSQYQHQCMHLRKVPSTEELVKFLLDQQLIDSSAIRNFVLREDFQKELSEQSEKGKTKIVKELAEKYDMHESSIWLILKKGME
ncbi:MAG: hypothetical protein AAF587_39200 [Bacteroidota bacterium]